MSNRKNKKNREYPIVTFPVTLVTRMATRLNENGENDYRETGRKNGFFEAHITDFEKRPRFARCRKMLKAKGRL